MSGSRWKPGESGNPNGRKPGTSRVAPLREAIGKAAPAIIRKLVKQAKDGDVQASRLLLERVLPPVKATEQAAPFEMPEGALTDQAQAVLVAAAAGDIPPGQAAALLAAFASLARLTAADELERRIAELEARLPAEPRA